MKEPSEAIVDSRLCASLQTISQVQALGDQLKASAKSSASLYTDCGTGSGDGTSFRDLGFYAKDSAGTQHFWGWTYDPNAKTLTQCKAYGDACFPTASSRATSSATSRRSPPPP